MINIHHDLPRKIEVVEISDMEAAQITGGSSTVCNRISAEFAAGNITSAELAQLQADGLFLDMTRNNTGRNRRSPDQGVMQF